MALLDAILEAEWQYRYFSFDSRWSETEEMASIRNGSGDDLFAVFDYNGCFVRGFDHESPMSPWNSREQPRAVWPGVLNQVPDEFAASLREPAFHMEDTTFCIWCRSWDSDWSCGSIQFPDGNDPDGSEWLLSLACSTADGYQSFARDYFEIDVSLEAVCRVFAHEPLSRDLLSAFPTARGFDDFRTDATEIGFRYAP